jgi:hypothetical protein
MIKTMKDENKLVTKKMFFDGTGQLETRFDAKIDVAYWIVRVPCGSA